MFLGKEMQLREGVPGVLALPLALISGIQRGLNLDAALCPGRIRLDQPKRLFPHVKLIKYLKKN
jgi:hypothetical protein